MQYQGGKGRLVDILLPIINKYKSTHKTFVEPFVGGFNVTKTLRGFDRIIVNDVNPFLVSMVKEYFDGTLRQPYPISRNYYEVRKNEVLKGKLDPTVSLGTYGWIGAVTMFNGKLWCGYSGDVDAHGKYLRDKQAQYARSILNTLNDLEPISSKIEYHIGSFNELHVPNEPCIIYCDPPYRNTTKYYSKSAKSIKFDYDLYYDWLRSMVALGHIVICSEYNMPDDFICIADKTLQTKIAVKNTSIAVEKIYIHNSQKHLYKKP